MGRTESILAGAAMGMALLEAASAQARPAASDGFRINSRNVAAPTGDSYQVGRGLLAAGDVTGAMAAFRQALLASPQSVDALNGLGVCYDRLGRYDISRGYYDSALAIEPDSPLVLNNLGYSLYLQGAFSAAIPALQRAAEASDPAVVAASQRVLALLAAQMREASARNSAREALAEIAAPRAHIELATNGEQRLVLGAPDPDKALVAALGENAALVTIARPLAGVNSAARAEREIDTTLTAIMVSDSDADGTAGLPSVVYLSSSTASTARTLTLDQPAPETTAETTPDGGSPDIVREATELAAPARITPPTPFMAVVAPRLGNRQRPIAPPRNAPLPVMLPVAGGSDPLDRGAIPAWLLRSRQTDLPPAGRATADRRRDNSETVAAFDSDIADLNRFAARMRGQPAVHGAHTDAERDEAVAKLQALIARIGAA